MDIKILASGSKGNSYCISDGGTSLLLDAGISINEIRLGLSFNLCDIAGALITHQHRDHCKALPDLVKSGIDVYAVKDVFDSFKKSKYFYRCKEIVSAITDDGQVNTQNSFMLGSFHVIPFDCKHDVPNLGFLIHSSFTGENLLYFTDTYYVKYKFKNLHYILGECNYSPEQLDKNIEQRIVPPEFKKRLAKSHMSIDTFIDFLKNNDLSKLKQIYLLHLSDTNGNEQEFKKLVQSVTGKEVYVC